jgi:hypothetical protein
VTPRTIEQIEEAFRDMGLDETSWGTTRVPSVAEPSTEPAGRLEQVFIRIETTTTPQEPNDADVA